MVLFESWYFLIIPTVDLLGKGKENKKQAERSSEWATDECAVRAREQHGDDSVWGNILAKLTASEMKRGKCRSSKVEIKANCRSAREQLRACATGWPLMVGEMGFWGDRACSVMRRRQAGHSRRGSSRAAQMWRER